MKETIFRAGHISVIGVKVSLEELEASAAARRMASQLALAFSDLLTESSWISTMAAGGFHSRAEQVNVLFAGGGAEMAFLHRAIPKFVSLPGSDSVSVYVAAARGEVSGIISRARAAVALGGCLPGGQWPQDAHTRVDRYRGLGAPAQKVGR